MKLDKQVTFYTGTLFFGGLNTKTIYKRSVTDKVFVRIRVIQNLRVISVLPSLFTSTFN